MHFPGGAILGEYGVGLGRPLEVGIGVLTLFFGFIRMFI